MAALSLLLGLAPSATLWDLQQQEPHIMAMAGVHMSTELQQAIMFAISQGRTATQAAKAGEACSME